MPELVADCPRCGTRRVTFSAEASTMPSSYEEASKHYLEVFCICRHCKKSTVFIAETANTLTSAMIGMMLQTKAQSSLADILKVTDFVQVINTAGIEAPPHVPQAILDVFNEGSKCLAVNCPNAASTMFRLCVDLATRELLPAKDSPGLAAKVRRDLGLRLQWLFDNQKLPESLQDLSHCVKEDGNDGAHRGTLTQEDGADLADFTTALLQRLYTEPKRLEIAQTRRLARRQSKP